MSSNQDGAATRAPHNPEGFPAGGLRILIVEDHRDTRVTLERILRIAKHEVAAAESAEQAITFAEQKTFDLVISDLGLPDMTGLELMPILRERFGLEGIAVSGYGTDDDVRRSQQAGFRHHLTKPIRLEVLRQLIGDFRRNSRTA